MLRSIISPKLASDAVTSAHAEGEENHLRFSVKRAPTVTDEEGNGEE